MACAVNHRCGKMQKFLRRRLAKANLELLAKADVEFLAKAALGLLTKTDLGSPNW